jgi:hypothetical protein
VAWEHAFSPWDVQIDRNEYFLMEGRKSTDLVHYFLTKNELDPKLGLEAINRKDGYYAGHSRRQRLRSLERGCERMLDLFIPQALQIITDRQ